MTKENKRSRIDRRPQTIYTRQKALIGLALKNGQDNWDWFFRGIIKGLVNE